MAKNLGTFTFAANFQVKAAEALDPRTVAASKADLINKANWPSDGDTIYVYKGLIVDCGEDGVYRLIDPAKALAADYSGWERIDAGAGAKIDNIYTYSGSVETYASLPNNAEVGNVYNVENEFEITSESALGDPIVKKYPAGTNVAWNGTTWDPLAGSVDLSEYATKSEVSTIRTDVAENTEAISGLSTALGETNAEVAKKVNAEEGKSLVSDEKIELIDTNANDIALLKSTDESLDTRLKVIEGAFSGEGGTVDLGEITATLTNQGNRITALETNSATKEEVELQIGGLTNQVGGFENRVKTLEDAKTLQEGQIGDLDSRLAVVEPLVDKVSALETAVGSLAVKSVAAGEKILATNSEGALSTTIKLGYDASTQMIQLKGISDAIVSELDATPFIVDGMLDDAEYDTATKEIVLTWNSAAGAKSMRIPMESLVDTYTAGNGLKVTNNKFDVVLDASTTNRLTVSEAGLLVDLSADIAALENTMDSKIEAAFEWQIVD